MKTLAFSGSHGSGKTQVSSMVVEGLRAEGLEVETVGSTSGRAWESFFKVLYPERDHSEWQSLPPEDHDMYQLYAMARGINDLVRPVAEYDVDFLILDRSIYDVYAYCDFKDDVSRPIQKLAADLLGRAIYLIDTTYLFIPEEKYAMDEKADRATYDRLLVSESFKRVADLYLPAKALVKVPSGELEEKAEFILKGLLKDV